jgi:catechol 2,3-dioxygenase-like lactoylglutathione lyase family enzyme
MLRTLDHVILGVRNLEAATSTYARLLGRRPSWRGEHPAAGTANSLFRLGNTYVELLAPEGDGATGTALRGWMAQRGEGPVGLAFGTDDADACHAWLVGRGLEPGPVEAGLGRDSESGAFRRWRRVPLPLAKTRGVLLFAIEHTSPDDLLPPAGLLGDVDASVSGLDHAVIQTPDAEGAKSLYEGLELRLALDRTFEQWGARLLFFRIGGITVEVAARLGAQANVETEPGANMEPESGTQPGANAEPEPESESDANAEPEPGRDSDANTAVDRLWGLSYRVPNADAAQKRLADLGFDVSPVRTGRKPGTRVFSVRGDPLGVPTLMLEPPG